ncbi:hypothetical protein D5086_032155 [Populus alba]|uniref:Uncharacterized protein n=1 Tax=Populus alba TaxID=43335 RepID=A0ACC4AKL6_POPAL
MSLVSSLVSLRSFQSVRATNEIPIAADRHSVSFHRSTRAVDDFTITQTRARVSTVTDYLTEPPGAILSQRAYSCTCTKAYSCKTYSRLQKYYPA